MNGQIKSINITSYSREFWDPYARGCGCGTVSSSFIWFELMQMILHNDIVCRFPLLHKLQLQWSNGSVSPKWVSEEHNTRKSQCKSQGSHWTMRSKMQVALSRGTVISIKLLGREDERMVLPTSYLGLTTKIAGCKCEVSEQFPSHPPISSSWYGNRVMGLRWSNQMKQPHCLRIRTILLVNQLCEKEQTSRFSMSALPPGGISEMSQHFYHLWTIRKNIWYI